MTMQGMIKYVADELLDHLPEDELNAAEDSEEEDDATE
jgi:hypothetical protein